MQITCIQKDFQIKNLSKYHNLYLKIDTLLLGDIFENYRKTYFNIYHLDPVKCLSSPGLAWQEVFEKTEIKLELLTDIIVING